MKNFDKYKEIILLSIIFLLAAFVRFYNFEERITFGPEQAISLLVSGDYINEKFSLLGLPSTQRTTSLGHIIFYPPVFNYSLVPLLLIFNYKVIPITAYFALLNLLTGLVLYIFVKKFFKPVVAYFALSIFLFNDLMIYHSLFIWSVNYLPILAALLLFYLFKVYKKVEKNYEIFIIGLLVSLSFGVEYLYVFTGFLIISFIIFFSKNKIKSLLLFCIGFIIGVLPTIIFDLTHEFYHLKTLFQYFLDTISLPSQSKISYYHFLQFWPLLAVVLAVLLDSLFNKSKPIAVGLLSLYIFLNLVSPNVSFDKPIGMPDNLNILKLMKAAELIAKDKPENFNVAMTFDFDSRAHPLRYLLKCNYGLKSQGVEDYPKSDILYILTDKNYSVADTGLWEISSFSAKKKEILGTIDDFVVYKLTKTE